MCSARSGCTKTLGTTNLLLRAASEVLKPRTKPLGCSGSVTPVSTGLFCSRRNTISQSPPSPSTPLNESEPLETLPEYHITVNLIRREHLVAARSSVRDPEILKELEEEIERDCEWLRNFLLAAKV